MTQKGPSWQIGLALEKFLRGKKGARERGRRSTKNSALRTSKQKLITKGGLGKKKKSA